MLADDRFYKCLFVLRKILKFSFFRLKYCSSMALGGLLIPNQKKQPLAPNPNHHVNQKKVAGPTIVEPTNKAVGTQGEGRAFELGKRVG